MRFVLTAVTWIVASASSSIALDNTSTVYGKVTDAANGFPINAVRVIINVLQRETLSDSDGVFRFTGVKPGTYLLSFSHPGYVEHDEEISTNDTLAIRLDAVVFHTPEVVVTSTKGKVSSELQPVPTVVVDGASISQTGCPTVSDALSQEPGIALVRDGMWETDVSIRGMSRNNIVMMVDNTRIETANDIATALSLINPFDLDRIEVIKGSSSALAGTGAFGGVVNCLTKTASYSERTQVGAEALAQYESVDQSDAEYLAVERESEIFKLRASGEYRKAENYQTPEGAVPNSQFMDFGLTGEAGVKLFNSHSLDLTYQRFQAQNTGIAGGTSFPASATAEYTLARRELYKAEYSIPMLMESFPLLTIRASDQIINRNVLLVPNSSVTKTPHAKHTTGTIQAEGEFVPAAGHFLTAGIEIWERELDSKRETYTPKSMIEESPLPDSWFRSSGAYVQDEWQAVPERTTIVLGARYDAIRVHNDLTMDTLYIKTGGATTIPANQKVLWYTNTSNSESWNANIGAQQRFNGTTDVSVLASTAFRAPSLEERYQYLDNGGLLQVGNPDLQPEHSIGLDAGLKWHPAFATLQADVYYNQYTDLVSLVYGTFEGTPALLDANIGKARIYGYELTTEISPLPNLVVSLNLDYVRGEKDSSREYSNLPQISPMRGAISFEYLIQYAGTLETKCEMVSNKKTVSTGEPYVAGYALVDADFTSSPFTVEMLNATLTLGAHNIFNRAYMNFLSTARGFIKYEPGRNLYVSLSLHL